MEKFTINILGAKVTYISSVPLKDYFIKNKNFMEFYNATILPVENELVGDDYVVIYNDTDDCSKPIVVNGNLMVVQYPFENLNESILIYLGYHFFEKQLGAMGICSCHSACVSKDGKATLIVGDAGAGKTSLAFQLCANGYKLISNDMTLVGISNEDKLVAYAGTKFMNLRLLSVQQNMPELLYLFQNNKGDNWTNKISVMAHDIGIDEEYEPTIIENVIFLRLDSREKLSVTSGDSWRNNFLLYQNTSSHIRGSAATFIDKNGHPIGYIPPMETEETYYKRSYLLNKINKNENYKYVVGSLPEVVEYVDELYRKDNKVRKRINEKK